MRFIYTNHGILSEERVQELKECGVGIEECGVAGMYEDDTIPPPDSRQPGELPGYRPIDSMTDMDEGGPSTRRAIDDVEIWSSIEDLRDDPEDSPQEILDFGPEEDDQDLPFENDDTQEEKDLDLGWTEEEPDVDERRWEWDSSQGKDSNEELQHSQTAFIDAPAPVIGEQDMAEGNPPDMNDLGRESTTMDLVKQIADSMVEAEQLRDAIKGELENNPKDYDLKLALQVVEREIAEKKVMIQHLAKKHSSLNEQEEGASLSEEEQVFSEEIALLRKIRAGDKKLFDTWPDVLNRMEKEEGIDATEGIGIIRNMERSLGNLGQDLQLFKDLSRTRKTAAKLLTRIPRLATWIPVELGGKFVG